MTRFATILTLAIATASSSTLALAEGPINHAALMAKVATYQPVQGFNHIVANTRFVGYFLQKPEGCAVTVMTARADDEALETPPVRTEILIRAADRAEFPVGETEALAMACTVDGDQLKVVALSRDPLRTAQR